MRWFSRSDVRSFHLLNATQFLGALNDNIFKLLVIYFLINIRGQSASSEILALAGAIYVIPFLLFSSGAGVLADRISKTKIVVGSKVLELIIMLYAVLAISLHWEFGSYLALFLMATQSAIFGPSKYGIIPELVESKMISKANSSLTSLTYLAIILGTFLASFLTDITNKNFILVAWVCVIIALLGLATSFGIKKTEPQRSQKEINPFFFYEIYQTVRLSWRVPHLLTAMFGSSFFLFIGAYTQLNIIPFAMQSLGLSEVGGGYLFLVTAIGIAIGAVIAGRISKERVEPGLPVIAGILIAIFLFILYLFSFSLTATILSLIFLGIFGGCFLIPFDSFIQTHSPNQTRGQVIAAANFFSFFGVLIAAFVIYLFGERWQLQAATGFALMGFLTLITDLFLFGRLSSYFLPFLAEKILPRYGSLQIASPFPPTSSILFIQSDSWFPVLLLFGSIPKLKILLPDRFRFPWFNGWFNSFVLLPEDPELLKKKMKDLLIKGETLALFFHKEKDNLELLKSYEEIFKDLQLRLSPSTLSEERPKRRFLFFRFRKKEITIAFPK